MSAALKNEPTLADCATIYSMCVMAHNETKDPKLAKENVINFLMERRDVLERFIRDILVHEVAGGMSRVSNDINKNAVRGFNAPSPVLVAQDGSLLRKVMETEAARFMDTMLISGVRLGDASADQCREASDRMLTESQRSLVRSKWLGAIADAVEKNGGLTVKDALPESSLARMWEEANA
jgi:hypothetical protein